MSQSPRSNNILAGDIEYIRQLVYSLSTIELQQVLEAVNQFTYGNELRLQKRVLFLLKSRASKTKVLRQTILQVYNSRSQQNQQPQQQPSILQPILQPPQHQMQNQSSYTSSRPNPIQFSGETPSPAIQFEDLPFFKIVQTLLMPTYCNSNAGSANFVGLFYLKDNVRQSIVESWNIAGQEHKTKVILKLLQVGLDENDNERLPYNIKVTVNNNECEVPELNFSTATGITPWHCNVPIDLTQQSELKYCLPNILKIIWSEEPHEYMAGVYVAQKLTWDDLLIELKNRPVRASDKTKELIKSSMENDADMDVDIIFASMMDPLSKLKMQLPARGVNCIHLQCFDAIQFLQMNEQKQKWICPICKKKIKFQDIEVDEFFLNIVQSPNLSKDCENVLLLKDGTWSEKKNYRYSINSRRNDCQITNDIEVFTLSDSDVDSDEIISKPKRFKTNPPKTKQSVIQSGHLIKTKDLKKPSESNFVFDLTLNNNLTSSVSDSSVNPVNVDLLNISNSGSNNCVANSSRIINNKHKKKYAPKPVLCVITLD